jgi:hypothetical protein
MARKKSKNSIFNKNANDSSQDEIRPEDLIKNEDFPIDKKDLLNIEKIEESPLEKKEETKEEEQKDKGKNKYIIYNINKL